MNLYIAGPMSGYTDWNFYAFLDAELWLWKKGFNAINPARMDLDAGFEPRGATGLEPTLGLSRRDVLKKDMVAICDGADGVALLDGWESSTGAKAEVALAEALGIPVRTVKDWALHVEGPWIEVAGNE